MSQVGEAAAVPPHVQLVQMASAYWVSRLVYAMAKLGLADRLKDGPLDAAALAPVLGVHAPSLHRLLRALAGLGLLTEGEGGRFGLTPLGAALQTGAPGAGRASVLSLGSDWFASGFQDILHSIETGRSAVEKWCGKPLFEHLAGDPEASALFNEMMVGFHGTEPPAVAEAYDFSAFGTIVDVGGSRGNLLAAILARHAGPRGILFDRPHVVAEAPAFLAARDVQERIAIEAGDFFEAVPAGGDLYLMSHVIHDWHDADCLTILGHCRRVMPPDGRLMLIEMVLPAGDTPHPGKMLDMVMLVAPGGLERTETEYATLLAAAGFRLQRVIPTASAVSIVEAVPA